MKNFENVIAKADEISKEVISINHVNLRKPITQYKIATSIDSVIHVLIGSIDELVFANFSDDNFLGFSIKDEYGTSICINKILEDKNDVRRGFTIAHEVGHCILGHPIDESYTVVDQDIYSSTHKYEREANIFASNLLLPFNVLLEQIQRGYFLIQISKVSQISKQMISVRILEILETRFGIQPNISEQVLAEYQMCNHSFEVKKTSLFLLFDAYRKIVTPEIPLSNYLTYYDQAVRISNLILKNK